MRQTCVVEIHRLPYRQRFLDYCREALLMHQRPPRRAASLTRPASVERYVCQPVAQLPHGGEGRCHQDLIFLPDRSHTGLGRPLAATLAGFFPHAGALVEILRRFLKKNILNQAVAIGRIRISHLGNPG